jgi:hypothetical protein
VPQNTAELRVGRLLEVRPAAGYANVAAVDVLFDALEQQTRNVPTEVRLVAAVDWRFCPLMSPEAAQRVSQRIAANNLRTERSAALVDSDAPIAVLQFLRVIRESNFPDRKLFFKQIELVSYLTDLLTFEELARLHAFLAEGPATASRLK